MGYSVAEIEDSLGFDTYDAIATIWPYDIDDDKLTTLWLSARELQESYEMVVKAIWEYVEEKNKEDELKELDDDDDLDDG